MLLRNKSQVFRQRPRDRHLKQRPRSIGIDGQRTVSDKKNRDLRLSAHSLSRDWQSPADVRQERMRVLAKAHAQSKGQVIPEERRAVLEIAGANQRRRRWIRHSL